MNNKLLQFARSEGYCCLWAFLEANKSRYTSDLVKDIEGVCTQRALQQNRAKHRKQQISCEELKTCLKKRIRDGFPVEPIDEKN